VYIIEFNYHHFEFEIKSTMISLNCRFLALLSFVLGQVQAATYINQYQQFFDIINDNLGERVINTKALTPVNVKQVQPFPPLQTQIHWAFASTISDTLDTAGSNTLKTLLVKLRGNAPDDDPFKFEWANIYGRKDILLDVEDVVHETIRGSGYILCGKVKVGDEPWRAFLLRTDNDGKINVSVPPRLYDSTYSFKSVVPMHKGNGYIAVGQTSSLDLTTKKGRSALYVVVDKNLVVQCIRETNGYSSMSNSPVESGWNKVITYNKEVRGKFGYAVVGETIFDYKKEDCEKEDNSNVLVATVNGVCKVDFEYMYADKKKIKVAERGFSIATISTKRGDLAITGNAKYWKNCDSDVVFDDILVFVLNRWGTVNWGRRYDVQSGVSFQNNFARVINPVRYIIKRSESSHKTIMFPFPILYYFWTHTIFIE
jgi:hypothetical protein